MNVDPKPELPRSGAGWVAGYGLAFANHADSGPVVDDDHHAWTVDLLTEHRPEIVQRDL